MNHRLIGQEVGDGALKWHERGHHVAQFLVARDVSSAAAAATGVMLPIITKDAFLSDYGEATNARSAPMASAKWQATQ